MCVEWMFVVLRGEILYRFGKSVEKSIRDLVSFFEGCPENL